MSEARSGDERAPEELFDMSVGTGSEESTPDPAEAQDRGYDWSWSRDADDICIPEQPATACHWNPRGMIVVRQSCWPDDDSDHIILLAPENVPKLIDALTRMVEADQ